MKKGIILIGAISSLFLVGCFSSEPLSREDTVIAKIGKDEITLKEVDAAAYSTISFIKGEVGEDFENQINSFIENDDDKEKVGEYRELKDYLINGREDGFSKLIQNKLLALEASKKKLFSEEIWDENRKVVFQVVEEVLNNTGYEANEEEVKKFISEKANEFADKLNISKEILLKQQKESAAASIMKEELGTEIQITDEEVEGYYNENYGVEEGNSKSLEEVRSEIKRDIAFEEYKKVILQEVERLGKEYRVKAFLEKLSF